LYPRLIKLLFENLTGIYYKISLLYTAEKTMFEKKFCEECGQRHSCQELYRQLGNSKSPSVVFKVVVAFLMPLVVFIAALAAFEKILAGTISGKELRTGLSFMLALGVTFIVVGCSLLARRKNKKLTDRCQNSGIRSQNRL